MGESEVVKEMQCSGEVDDNVPKMETNGCSRVKNDTISSAKTSATKTRLEQELISVLPSTVWFVVQCLLCYVVLLAFLAPLLPFIAVFYIMKTAERVIVKMTSGDIPMSAMDALWQQLSEENRLAITAVVCVENEGSVEEGIKNFRQRILERMVNATKANGELLYPRTRCKIRPGWFQYFFQEDESFKIDNHVFKWEGEVPRSKDELSKIVSKLSNEPFPEGRSPWYFCCVPTDFGDRDIAVVFRVKHSVADGISLVKFLIYKCSDKTTPQTLPKKFSSSGRSLLLAKALLMAPRYILQLLLTFADRSCLHGPKLSGVKKVVWHEGFDLQLIKKIKSATGTTVNDVLMSCLSLAVRRYFQRKGVENPDDFTASLPVDIRSSAASMDLTFANKFSVVFPKLAVATDGAIKQLLETKARMDETKVSGAPLASAGVIFFSQELLPEFLISKVNTFLTQKASCVLSNVPGPQHTLTLNGNRIKYMVFWVPSRDNIGVGLSIFTYAGKVIVGVQGDVSVLSDPEIIVEEFGNAVNEIFKCIPRTNGPVINGHAKHSNPGS